MLEGFNLGYEFVFELMNVVRRLELVRIWKF